MGQIHSKDTERILYRTYIKQSMSRHIVITFLKIKNKEIILKMVRE